MVLHPPRRRATRRSPPTAAVTFRRTEPAARTTDRPRRGTRPARRPVDRQVRRRSPTERAAPAPPPAARTPTRTPSTRSPSSSTRRRPPTCACCTPPRTTGRTRAATSASTARSASSRPARRSCSAGKGVRQARARPAVGPAGRRRAHDRARCSAARRATADGTVPRGAGRRTPSPTCSTPRERPRHVVGFLFDGTNANVLYDMAARGEAPNVARLIEMGVAFGHGAMASLPTVTLANHTSIITGAHPGHHGILQQRVVRPRDRRAGHHQLVGDVAVVHAAPRPRHRDDPRRGAPHVARRVHRVGQRAVRHAAPTTRPSTSSGAARCRRSRRTRSASRTRPNGSCARRRTTRGRRSSTTWASTRRSASSAATTATSATRCRGSCGATSRSPTPRCTKAARTRRSRPRRYATATAASARSSTRSNSAGVFDDCAFVLVADHGMEENDPACRGDWDVALRAAGVEARDEAYGFLYFGVRPTAVTIAERIPIGGGHAQCAG